MQYESKIYIQMGVSIGSHSRAGDLQLMNNLAPEHGLICFFAARVRPASAMKRTSSKAAPAAAAALGYCLLANPATAWSPASITATLIRRHETRQSRVPPDLPHQPCSTRLLGSIRCPPQAWGATAAFTGGTSSSFCGGWLSTQGREFALRRGNRSKAKSASRLLMSSSSGGAVESEQEGPVPDSSVGELLGPAGCGSGCTKYGMTRIWLLAPSECVGGGQISPHRYLGFASNTAVCRGGRMMRRYSFR